MCGVLVIALAAFALQNGEEAPQLWLFLVGAILMETVFINFLFKA